MPEPIITIDCGTTNTRAILWQGETILAVEKSPVGVRNTAIDGNTDRLKAAVKDCIDGVLARGGIKIGEVKRVIASGMITSNVGLFEIPHLVVPAGIDELAAGMKAARLPDVCDQPIYFIPGVKNYGGAVEIDQNFENMDMMRGEEVETVALLEQLEKGKKYLFVLPGSHTKFVSVDEAGKITGCLTTIAGELLSVITEHTIIADAVGHRFVEAETYDKELLLKGFLTAKKVGLARACFSGRILSMFSIKDKTKIANFILGAALQSDVEAVLHSGAIKIDGQTTVVVSGKDPLRKAIYDILTSLDCFEKCISFAPDEKFPLAGAGAKRIAQKNSEIEQ